MLRYWFYKSFVEGGLKKTLSPLGLPVYLVSKVSYQSGEFTFDFTDIFEADTPLLGVLTLLQPLCSIKTTCLQLGTCLYDERVAATFGSIPVSMKAPVFVRHKWLLDSLFLQYSELTLWQHTHATTTHFASSQKCFHVFLTYFYAKHEGTSMSFSICQHVKGLGNVVQARKAQPRCSCMTTWENPYLKKGI